MINLLVYDYLHRSENINSIGDYEEQINEAVAIVEITEVLDNVKLQVEIQTCVYPGK